MTVRSSYSSAAHSRSRRNVVALVVIAVSIAAVGSTSILARRPPSDAVTGARVALLLVPRLTWTCAKADAVTAPWYERYAVGSLSMRTADREPSNIAVAATIGAGARTGATGVPEVRVEGDVAAPRVAAGTVDALRNAAREARYGAEPGALGDAAQVTLLEVRSALAVRSDTAALIAMDRQGAVHMASGEPGGDLAGRLDPLVALPARLDAAADAKVVVVDVAAVQSGGCPTVGGLGATEVNDRLGRLLSIIESRFDPTRDLIVIATSDPPVDPEELGVIALRGPGVEAGYLSSPSTRADRFVTLPDIAPTILTATGTAVPESMTGRSMRVSAGGSDVARLIDDNSRALGRDGAFAWIVGAWVVLTVLALAGTLLVRRVLPGDGSRSGRVGAARCRRLTELLCLWSVALPAVAWPLGRLPAPVSTRSTWLTAVVVIVAGITAVVVLGWRGITSRGTRMELLLWLLWGWLGFLGIATQMSAVFGYSPIDGGRFAGFGNQAFVLFGFAALALVTVGDLALVPAGVLLAGTVVINGVFGADVGAILSMVPAALVLLWLRSGRRLGRAVATWAVLGAVAVLTAAIAIDLSRSDDQRTHLGRLVSRLGEPSGRLVLERKILTMASTFVQLWAPVMIVAIGFFVVTLLRPSPRATRILDGHRGLEAFGWAMSCMTLLGIATNDSGLRIGATVVALAVTFACWCAVATPVGPGPTRHAGVTSRPSESTPEADS